MKFRIEVQSWNEIFRYEVEDESSFEILEVGFRDTYLQCLERVSQLTGNIPQNIWQPLYRASVVDDIVTSQVFGADMLDLLSSRGEVWLNDIYQVMLTYIPGDQPDSLIHLSIKRIDREPIHDWRDIQLIKNQLVGPEREGIELYPAESRLVDTANQFHVFVFGDGVKIPIGFDERLVSEDEIGKTKQRLFYDNMKPADLSDMREVLKKALERGRL